MSDPLKDTPHEDSNATPSSDLPDSACVNNDSLDTSLAASHTVETRSTQSRIQPNRVGHRKSTLPGSLTILGFQLGIVFVGILLAWLFGLFPQTTLLQSNAEFRSANWFGHGAIFSSMLGIVAAGFMYATIYMLSLGDFRWFQKIERLVGDSLLQLLRRQKLAYLITLCALAGVGEELLFRWAIQAGIEKLCSTWFGPIPAVAMAIFCSSVLFGLAHFVTRAYFVIATLIGIFLSLVVLYGGGLWAAILAHAIYDLICIFWLLRRPS